MKSLILFIFGMIIIGISTISMCIYKREHVPLCILNLIGMLVLIVSWYEKQRENLSQDELQAYYSQFDVRNPISGTVWVNPDAQTSGLGWIL